MSPSTTGRSVRFFVHWSVLLSVISLAVPSSVPSFVRSYSRSCVRLLVCSFVRSLVHSLVRHTVWLTDWARTIFILHALFFRAFVDASRTGYEVKNGEDLLMNLCRGERMQLQAAAFVAELFDCLQ